MSKKMKTTVRLDAFNDAMARVIQSERILNTDDNGVYMHNCKVSLVESDLLKDLFNAYFSLVEHKQL